MTEGENNLPSWQGDLIVRLRATRSCSVCDGDGVKRNGNRCGGCDGTGMVLRYDRTGTEAAYEIERLRDERYQLAYAITGGEDAPGLLDSLPVDQLVNIARSNERCHMEQIDRAETAVVAANALQSRLTTMEAEKPNDQDACPSCGGSGHYGDAAKRAIDADFVQIKRYDEHPDGGGMREDVLGTYLKSADVLDLLAQSNNRYAQGFGDGLREAARTLREAAGDHREQGIASKKVLESQAHQLASALFASWANGIEMNADGFGKL